MPIPPLITTHLFMTEHNMENDKRKYYKQEHIQTSSVNYGKEHFIIPLVNKMLKHEQCVQANNFKCLIEFPPDNFLFYGAQLIAN